MSGKLDVLEAALQLNDEERREVAQKLMESLLEDEGYEEAWAEEIARRLKEADEHPERLIPWEEARRMIFEGRE
jgi:putative addiction module component (TIGR02574 family)